MDMSHVAWLLLAGLLFGEYLVADAQIRYCKCYPPGQPCPEDTCFEKMCSVRRLKRRRCCYEFDSHWNWIGDCKCLPRSNFNNKNSYIYTALSSFNQEGRRPIDKQ